MRRAWLLGLGLGAWLGAWSSLAWADEGAALIEQLALPPVAATRAVIAALPQVRAAAAGVALAQARGQRLEAGTHEWVLKAGSQRRSESAGPQYTEGELALERPIRWAGKAQADRELGQAGVVAGKRGYADVWHENVRGLLQAWYDWQRARSAAQVLAQQAMLAQSQLDVSVRRVKAGDAPRIDQLMAQAELERAQASEQQAGGREQVLRQGLQKRFSGLLLSDDMAESPPGLTGKASVAAPDNTAAARLQLPGDDASWLQRITEDNHEIELAEAEVAVARLQAERIRLEAQPDPLLGVRAGRERGGQENVLGVYLAIPLAGAYRAADQRAALALLDAAEQRLLLTRQRVTADAQAVVLQAKHNATVSQRLDAVQQAMGDVAQLAVKAYSLGELSLSEALQARRAALEAALSAQAARWDARQAISRVLVDAHQLWSADEEGH